jgi:hypothetical protein
LKVSRFLILAFTFFLAHLSVCFGQQPSGSKIAIPSPPTLTVPADVSYALGEQTGKLNDILSRLDKMDPKLEDMRRDVDRLNTIAWLIGGVITLIFAPLIVEKSKDWLRHQKASGT